jgi:histidine ammonia-lyase
MRTVIVNGDALSVQDVIDVARGQARAELGSGVPARMKASREAVTAAIAGDAAVYGVNTGFGALADTRVGEQDLRKLQGAIIVSHAAGTGDPLNDAAVRAILLLRARTLAAGYSGPTSRGACWSCWISGCFRSSQARGRSAPPAISLSSRTWPSR